MELIRANGIAHQNAPRLFSTQEQLFNSLHTWIAAIAADAIAARGKFVIVTTGGRSVLELYRRLHQIDTDWRAWRVFWTDERCLPADHAQRNSKQAEDHWLRHVPLPRNNVFAVPAELGPTEAAKIYSHTLGREGQFDLVLLSLGDDGHIASIFPGMETIDEPDLVVPVFDAPKSPAKRVTMSLKALADTRRSLLLSVGERKNAALSAHFSGRKQPSTMLAQISELVVWTNLQLAKKVGFGDCISAD